MQVATLLPQKQIISDGNGRFLNWITHQKFILFYNPGKQKHAKPSNSYYNLPSDMPSSDENELSQHELLEPWTEAEKR
jgi:hypothetical protein